MPGPRKLGKDLLEQEVFETRYVGKEGANCVYTDKVQANARVVQKPCGRSEIIRFKIDEKVGDIGTWVERALSL